MNSECNNILNSLEEQIDELESMVFETYKKTKESDGCFSRSEIESKFKNNTASARQNGSIVIYKVVKEVGNKVQALLEIEKVFPAEPRINALKKRYGACGQHLISMINLMETWQ